MRRLAIPSGRRAKSGSPWSLNRARLPFCWLRFLRSSPRRGNNRVSHPGVQLARAERERRPRVAPTMCKTARTPWVTASVPGTSVNGTIHASWSFCSYHRRPADGRTAWHAARRAARSGSSMVHALSSQVLSPSTSSWASPVHFACLRRAPSSDGRGPDPYGRGDRHLDYRLPCSSLGLQGSEFPGLGSNTVHDRSRSSSTASRRYWWRSTRPSPPRRRWNRKRRVPWRFTTACCERHAVWKSTNELGCHNCGQRRVDGVEAPRHRADAVMGTTSCRWCGASEIFDLTQVARRCVLGQAETQEASATPGAGQSTVRGDGVPVASRAVHRAAAVPIFQTLYDLWTTASRR